ncbi:unnamed protein product, partial [marine sediment metagenome]
MTRKILWCGLSFLLVASLVLASCAKEEVVEEEEEEEEEVVEEEEEEEEEEEPAVGVPQRGGTFSLFTEFASVDPAGFDPSTSTTPWSTSVWVNPFLEWLVKGDIEQYGP